MSWAIVDVEQMSAPAAAAWRARQKRRRAAKCKKRLTDEERAARQRVRDRVRRKRWEAQHPAQYAASKRHWFEKNPGYKAQWMRDKRAEAARTPRLLKTPEEKKATKREYDRRRYAEHREEKLTKVRESRRAKRAMESQ